MTKKNEPGKSVQLKARIDDAVAEGIYANCASIMHNQSEFIIDFGRIVPGRQEVKVHSRILTSPVHAKQLLLALEHNIGQYEAKCGPITLPGEPSPVPTTGFVQ